MRYSTRYIHKFLGGIFLRLSIENMAVLILSKDGKLVLEGVGGNGLKKQTLIDSIYEGKGPSPREAMKNGIRRKQMET